IEGQATIALEIDRQLAGARFDIAVAPVGGGGLAAGLTRYWRGAPTAPQLLFAEAAGAASLRASLEAGRRVRLETIDSFAEGAAVAEPGALPFSILRDQPAAAVQVVPEGRICQTMLEMLNLEGIVLEPAGALSVAALPDLRDVIYGRNVLL